MVNLWWEFSVWIFFFLMWWILKVDESTSREPFLSHLWSSMLPLWQAIQSRQWFPSFSQHRWNWCWPFLWKGIFLCFLLMSDIGVEKCLQWPNRKHFFVLWIPIQNSPIELGHILQNLTIFLANIFY